MRRRLLILAAFLLAGAVVNVAVAWALAIRVAAPNPLRAVADTEGLYVDPLTGDHWWCQVTHSFPGYTTVVLEPAVVVTGRIPTAYSGDVIVEMGEVTTVESRLYHTWTTRRLWEWAQAQGINIRKLLAGDSAERAKWTALSPGGLADLRSQFQNPPSGAVIWLDPEAVPGWAEYRARL